MCFSLIDYFMGLRGFRGQGSVCHSLLLCQAVKLLPPDLEYGCDDEGITERKFFGKASVVEGLKRKWENIFLS
jgi:hypothetical protein